MPASAAAQMGTTAKRAQSEVAYGPAYSPAERCGNCVHFDGQGTCELVEGTISPEGVCDLFEPVQPA